MTPSEDEHWMAEAMELARAAGLRGEVPVGAVAVCRELRVAGDSNHMEASGDATAHAEMNCLRHAAGAAGTWRLDEVTLYVTLEPCPMCASAMVLARLGRLVYAAADPKKGADGSAYRLLDHPRNNHRVRVTRGVMAEQSSALLSGFFRSVRSGPATPDP